ncbi:hypothetical protein BQ8794_300021 [Mesorhizobium prunaredense]|uniref:Uncharacterized protein n=1 Tax=Mesorhizobium prunaredense TaxID=1631249 RepID=A0A1R3VB80_9HYPH|nr:hypothetical protein BQ8794_300021 [Mesorhizobium prunaredense]
MSVVCDSLKKFAAALAKTAQGVYRHPTFSDSGPDAALSRGQPGHFDHVVEHIHGRTETKNLSVEARHAPFGRCIEGPDLCRGQEFRRDAPAAPYRPEDRHVSRSPGSRAEGKLRTLSTVCDYRRTGHRAGLSAFCADDRPPNCFQTCQKPYRMQPYRLVLLFRTVSFRVRGRVRKFLTANAERILEKAVQPEPSDVRCNPAADRALRPL